MQEVAVYSLGELPAFLRVNTDPTYWTERFNYECSYMLRQAALEGMSFKKAEESDFDAFNTALNSFLGLFKTWVNAAFDRSNSRLLVQDFTELVPAIITTGGTVASAALSGGSSLLIPLLVNAGLQLVSHVVAGQANNLLSGESANIADIAEAIRESFLKSRNAEEALSLLSTDGNSTILSIAELLRAALLSEHGTGENYVMEAFLRRFLEEWRLEIEGKDGNLAFTASQGESVV